MKPYDVYSYGVVSSSTLYTVKGAFPALEGYGEIECMRYMTGGEATNSSIVLSRLGVQVKLDGNWLGDDESGKRTKKILDEYEIDTSRLALTHGYKSVQEVVFAAQGKRTIFGTYGRLHEDKRWNVPIEDDVVQAKVICLDPFFEKTSALVAKIGADSGIPVVTVDCLHDDPLIANTAAVVISESYLRWKYPHSDLKDVFREYQEAVSGLVVFTFGDNQIWYGRTSENIKSFEPYSIEAVDSSGAGDSFRAGIVYGFLNEWDDERMIDFSAAIAALTCTRSPGVQQSPRYDDVVSFMQHKGMNEKVR
jgi:sugar/nucleoside kinase (ribokinase family)